jgi:hypothetical protein
MKLAKSPKGFDGDFAKNFAKNHFGRITELGYTPQTLEFTGLNKTARDGTRTRGPDLGKGVREVGRGLAMACKRRFCAGCGVFAACSCWWF